MYWICHIASCQYITLAPHSYNQTCIDINICNAKSYHFQLHHFQPENQFIQRKDAEMILFDSTLMPRNNRLLMHQIGSELLFVWAISVEDCKVHKVWKFDAIEHEMVPICVQNLKIYSTMYAKRKSRNEIPSTSMCSSFEFSF